MSDKSYLTEWFGFEYAKQKAYAGHMKDENGIRTSASGGAATMLYKIFLALGAIAYGVEYTLDFKGANYTRVEKLDDIGSVKNSKYVWCNKSISLNESESSEKTVFEDASEMIRSGKIVLFIGLPCEVAALYSVLKKNGLDAQNLFTVDIICHGTIPEAVLKEYVQNLENKYRSTTKSFCLRYKTDNVLPKMIRAQFENGDIHLEEFDSSDYGYVFHHYLRNACYCCKYKGENHTADITIGDYWGSNRETPGGNNLGTSVFLPHTEKGREIIEMVKNSNEFELKEADIYNVLINNHNYFRVAQKPEDNDWFWKMFDKEGLSKAVRLSKERNRDKNIDEKRGAGMFNGNKEWKQDIFERVVHIEGKEDELNRKLDEQTAILDRIFTKLRDGIATESEADAFMTKSYAQCGEDVLIYNLFKKLGFENPTYIDIGAHHPYEISNTALFYMSGCRGTNVEANPNLIEAFYKERPDDRNICCGVGAENGELPFYMIDDRSGQNSFKKECVDMFLQSNPDFSLQKTENIRIRTLSDIMDEIGEVPDYMSIDIEGMEYEVLSRYDLKNRGPIIITLEVMRGNVEYGKKVIEMMEDAGYFMYLKIYSNITFVREEYREEIYSL